MESIYLDTSAFVKRFSRERASDIVDMLFTACQVGKVKIIISSWVINKGIAVIDRKFRRREISLEERNMGISTLLEQTDSLATTGSLAIIPVTQDNVDGSLEFVMKHHLSAEDALHLFSAVISSCKIFVAADRVLVEVANVDLHGFNIEKSPDQRSLSRLLNL